MGYQQICFKDKIGFDEIYLLEELRKIERELDF